MTPVLRALGMLALAGLAGCAPPGSLSVRGGALQVQGAVGYCADPEASNPEAGFVVLGGCDRLGLGTAPAADAFLTVQVAEAGSAAVSGSEAALAALLRTPVGAAQLSRQGQAEAVEVRQTDHGGGVVTVRFAEAAPPPVAGLAPEEWRAFFDLRGRLVTVALRVYARRPLSPEAAQGLLAETIAGLRRANPG